MTSIKHIQRIEITCNALPSNPRSYHAAPSGPTFICCKCGHAVVRVGDERHEVRPLRGEP